MAIQTKSDEERCIRKLEQSRVDEIDKTEPVIGKRNAGPPPISLRLSTPLLEALDRIALSEHRKRSNLIQHILWEYVHGGTDLCGATARHANNAANRRTAGSASQRGTDRTDRTLALRAARDRVDESFDALTRLDCDSDPPDYDAARNEYLAAIDAINCLGRYFGRREVEHEN